MKKAAFFLCMIAFFVSSCGENSETDENNWGNQDNEVTDEDSGNTGDTGDSRTDTDIEDIEDTVDDSDTSDQSDTSDTSEQSDKDEIPDEDTTVDPLLAQFVGTWAQKIILKSVSSTSLAKNVPSVTIRYILAEMSVDKNGNLDMTRKGSRLCWIDNETGDSVLNKGVVLFNEPDSKMTTIYHFWKPNEVPGFEESANVTVTENGEEISFATGKEWELRGATMTDPATEEMVKPKDDGGLGDDDPRIYDHDVDGKPAYTIKFSGFVNGDIYYVQRLYAIYTGKLVSEGKIEGNVEWGDDQYAHTATPNITLKGQKTTVTETNNSVFQFIKVDDTMTCTDLIAQKHTLFDVANPNTNPDGDPDN